MGSTQTTATQVNAPSDDELGDGIIADASTRGEDIEGVLTASGARALRPAGRSPLKSAGKRSTPCSPQGGDSRGAEKARGLAVVDHVRSRSRRPEWRLRGTPAAWQAAIDRRSGRGYWSRPQRERPAHPRLRSGRRAWRSADRGASSGRPSTPQRAAHCSVASHRDRYPAIVACAAVNPVRRPGREG